MSFTTQQDVDRWFDNYYRIFHCIYHNCIEVDYERHTLQAFQYDVGRLLHKKEEDIGIWHCNGLWRNYLGYECHDKVQRIYVALHQRLHQPGYDPAILSGMLIIGICIAAEGRLRSDPYLTA